MKDVIGLLIVGAIITACCGSTGFAFLMPLSALLVSGYL